MEQNKLWDIYWQKQNIKRWIIEVIRKGYFARQFSNKIRKYIERGPALEAGSGSCAISAILSRQYNVVAVDNSIEAVRVAKKKYKFPIIQADMIKLPFEDKSFELVFNQGVMEHFNNKEFIVILNEFKRVANKLVVIVPAYTSVFRIYNPFPDKNQRFMFPKELKYLLSKVYTRVEVKIFPESFFLSIIGVGWG